MAGTGQPMWAHACDECERLVYSTSEDSSEPVPTSKLDKCYIRAWVRSHTEFLQVVYPHVSWTELPLDTHAATLTIASFLWPLFATGFALNIPIWSPSAPP